ncbi:MAG TPA: VOC family protein [Gemmatimonadaceae bacterium]|nr:VOC family protein [Gemmatimonadaceae bacterium]
MWVANGVPIGGCMRLTEEMLARQVPPHWLAYIGTEDVHATVAKARSLGAQVYVEPFDVPTVGRMAVLADPFGAAFAAYKPDKANREETVPKVGEFSWHELMTTDYKAAFEFYQTLFGWELASDEDMGELGIYRVYARNGRQLGGMFNKGPGMEQIPPNFSLYVLVDDIEAAVERVKTNGGQIANGPMEVPGGDWVANCFDPQGAAFSLHKSNH